MKSLSVDHYVVCSLDNVMAEDGDSHSTLASAHEAATKILIEEKDFDLKLVILCVTRILEVKPRIIETQG